MTILKRIVLTLLIVLICIAMIVFTAGNPGELNIELLHWQVTAPVSLAFATAFAIGWLFGVLCMGLYAFKVASERRTLRRNLRMSENEVSSLRTLPIDDAD